MDERMEEAWKGFLRHLAAKGYSQHIVADYGEDLEVFLTFLTAQGVKDLKAVGEGPLRAYEEWLSKCRSPKTGKPLSGITKVSRIRSVKKFFRWMEWTGWVLFDPAGCLTTYTGKHPLPKVLAVEEMERMVTAPDTATLGGIRSRAILEVWYGAGLWAEEMEGLTLTDVSTAERWVRAAGRMVPLEERAVHWLESYLGQVRPKWVLGSEPTQALWVSPSGEGVTRVALWQVVKRFANKVGLGGVGFAGKLRGSRAAHWLMAGVSREEVGRRLGIGERMLQSYAAVGRKLIRVNDPKEVEG